MSGRASLAPIWALDAPKAYPRGFPFGGAAGAGSVRQRVSQSPMLHWVRVNGALWSSSLCPQAGHRSKRAKKLGAKLLITGRSAYIPTVCIHMQHHVWQLMSSTWAATVRKSVMRVVGRAQWGPSARSSTPPTPCVPGPSAALGAPRPWLSLFSCQFTTSSRAGSSVSLTH